MAEADELGCRSAPGPELMLGDIILARGVCVARGGGEGAFRSSTTPPI